MTEQVDVVQLIMDTEESVRKEYEDAWKRLKNQTTSYERQQAKWSHIVESVKASLLTAGEVGEDDLPDADAVLDHMTMMLEEAFKLKKLLKAIQENQILRGQWDRLVMSIRLTGGDQNG